LPHPPAPSQLCFAKFRGAAVCWEKSDKQAENLEPATPTSWRSLRSLCEQPCRSLRSLGYKQALPNKQAVLDDCLTVWLPCSQSWWRSRQKCVSPVELAKPRHLTRNHIPSLWITMRAPRRSVQTFAVSSSVLPRHTFGALGISGTPLEVTHTIIRRRRSATVWLLACFSY